MAATKTTGLTENTTPALTDIMYLVDDPAGTAASQKITVHNVLKLNLNSIFRGAHTHAATTQRYIYPGGEGSDSNNAAVKALIFGTAATLKKVVFNVNSSTTGGTTLLSITKNGTPTSLQASYTATETGIKTVSADVSLAAEDLVSISLPSVTSGSMVIASITIVYELA